MSEKEVTPPSRIIEVAISSDSNDLKLTKQALEVQKTVSSKLVGGDKAVVVEIISLKHGDCKKIERAFEYSMAKMYLEERFFGTITENLIFSREYSSSRERSRLAIAFATRQLDDGIDAIFFCEILDKNGNKIIRNFSECLKVLIQQAEELLNVFHEGMNVEVEDGKLKTKK